MATHGPKLSNVGNGTISSQMNSTRPSLPTSSSTPNTTSATRTNSVDVTNSTKADALPVASNDSNVVQPPTEPPTDEGDSAPPPPPSPPPPSTLPLHQPQAIPSAPKSKGGFTDGHMPQIIGGLCGVLALGIIALVYSYWRYRKSRKRQSVFMADRAIIPDNSSPPRQNVARPQPVDRHIRPVHTVELSSYQELNSQSNLSQRTSSSPASDGLRVVTPCRVGTFENHAHVPNRVRGNSEKSSRPSFGLHETWSQEAHSVPASDLSFQKTHAHHAYPQIQSNQYPSPSASPRGPVFPKIPLSYNPMPYLCKDVSASQSTLPYDQGHPSSPHSVADASVTTTEKQRPLIESPTSRDHPFFSQSNRIPIRTTKSQPSLHHTLGNNGNFTPSKLRHQIPTSLTENPSQVYETGLMTSTPKSAQKPIYFDAVHQPPLNSSPKHLTTHSNRPTILPILIPKPTRDSELRTNERRPPIPLSLKPASPIHLVQNFTDAAIPIASSSTDQNLSPSQRAIKESMFLSPPRDLPKVHHDPDPSSSSTVAQDSQDSPVSKPVSFPLPLPGQPQNPP